MAERKKSTGLFRSTEDRMISGVFGGLAKYFDIDPVIVRLAGVLVFFMRPFEAFVLYVLATIIIPEGNGCAGVKDGKAVGIVLILAGALFTLQIFYSWLSFELALAMGLIALGLYMLVRK